MEDRLSGMFFLKFHFWGTEKRTVLRGGGDLASVFECCLVPVPLTLFTSLMPLGKKIHSYTLFYVLFCFLFNFSYKAVNINSFLDLLYHFWGKSMMSIAKHPFTCRYRLSSTLTMKGCSQTIQVEKVTNVHLIHKLIMELEYQPGALTTHTLRIPIPRSAQLKGLCHEMNIFRVHFQN